MHEARRGKSRECTRGNSMRETSVLPADLEPECPGVASGRRVPGDVHHLVPPRVVSARCYGERWPPPGPEEVPSRVVSARGRHSTQGGVDKEGVKQDALRVQRVPQQTMQAASVPPKSGLLPFSRSSVSVVRRRGMASTPAERRCTMAESEKPTRVDQHDAIENAYSTRDEKSESSPRSRGGRTGATRRHAG